MAAGAWTVLPYILCVALNQGLADFPFRNTSLPWSERVDDLVSRLSIEEIQYQMARGGAVNDGTPPIPRLGIKPYSWNTECLRGDVKAGNATGFPQALGLAASFSPRLVFQMAEAAAVEVRAKYNNYSRHGVYGRHMGVSCFSPVINIVRDPRWGRIQETYGEDPFQSGVLAASFIQGLQGNDTRYVRANAGCKHFAAYDGPENIPIMRIEFDAKVSERDLRTTFLPAFRACVKAGTYSFMCSCNSLNGVPTCASKQLLNDILREEWGFTGYVVSDDTAIENVQRGHHYANNYVDVVADCVNAGCNLELSGEEQNLAYMSMIDAIHQGKLQRKKSGEMVKPLFFTRMRLGEFDPPEMNPYSKLDLSVIESQAHQMLAIEAAMKSFVLLKNEGNTLPLKKAGYFDKIAVVGPMANNSFLLFGDYAPDTFHTFVQTPLQGLAKLAQSVNYAAGCDDTFCKHYDAESIKKAVASTEVIFVCLGTGRAVESEGNDRYDINLPGYQLQLLQDVAANRNGTPVVLLLFNAGPLNLTWADQSSDIAAILECFFPAQATGEALRRVMINEGPGSNPAGRLPVTWPAFEDQIFNITEYSMEGKTYRYFKGDPLYPYGYGLSYTQFSYVYLENPTTITAGQDLHGMATVSNIGNIDGDEVIQVYIQWMKATQPTPQLQLAWFDRVTIHGNGNIKVNFTVSAESMAVWVDNKGWIVEKGQMVLYVGGQQPNQKRQTSSNVLRTSYKIVGSKFLGRY
ncbi:LOW QUALITY PROTEIN: probable beta-D-xylosidase 5 [Haliotis rubra]|uniref:LOW QUALITY PROTEIN: probable beta-D-xylosidase 5 n=1 Tax=Haliotis rubra TaxID=36100 RepID=UPI001EE53F3C|nr:LOW QUALITY PROTEIN: probable beta-D-xylosidase 5 [Haliotis rubra]